VAISFAGWIDSDGSGISAGPNLGWGPLPLVSMFEAEGLACHLENDLDARAWGEWLRLDTEQRSLGDLMVINAGSGFALGLVIAGQLRRGFHRRAGEVGHWRPGIDGRCGCGQQGCVESLLGGANQQQVDLDDPDFRQRWIELAVATLAPVISALDPAHIIATGGILDHREPLLFELREALVHALPQAWWCALELRASGAGEALARLGVVDLAQRQQKG
jgi:predicted NBD/HSP70 family sugar kinase